MDGAKLFAGSVNWTRTGLAKNAELMVIVEDAAVARKLEELFGEDWYRSWLGHEPTY